MADNNLQNLTLSQKQLKAIPSIISQKSISEGCRKARISRTTFYEWLQEEPFRNEFEKQRRELVNEALHMLKVSATEAARVLMGLLEAESEGIRLKTALAILENTLKAIEIEDLQKRIEVLEERTIDKRRGL